ncbi:hypothetical protein F4780DRAFT_780454 [Xylariomycetidae sp. FL0641]|nr:hypothetical protein F4780DRAFT_780454 [Xylariomycetidae sp. FL0641]
MASQNSKYEGLRVSDHDDARSSTEVEDSLMGDEKQWRDVELNEPTRRTKKSGLMSSLRSSRWLIDTALLLIILALIVRDQWRRPAQGDNLWQFGQDMTGVGPKMSFEIKTFVSDQSYAPNNTADFFKPETLEKWNKLMPRGNGFVEVNDTQNYHDLPTPVIWPGKTTFTTSTTHQLHCLYAMVQTYSGLSSGHEIPDDHHWHMIHCFDYLRQAIMCSGDMALEGLETTFPDHNGGSDGWDAKHVCRRWDDVIDYLESKRPSDMQTIY